MNIITFNLSNQRLRRFTSGLVYANSYGKTIFKFNFNTPDWNSPTKTAVFSYRGKNYLEPLDENNMCKVPEEVLHEGYFLVSIHDGQGLVTNCVRVPVAPVPEDLLPDTPGGGNCDCGPSMVYVPEVDERKILSWTLQEVTDDMPEIPDTDLNPHDEWSADETESEYIWEEE